MAGCHLSGAIRLEESGKWQGAKWAYKKIASEFVYSSALAFLLVNS